MLTAYFIIMVAYMIAVLPISLVELLNDRTGYEELPTWLVVVIVILSVIFTAALWPLSLMYLIFRLVRGDYR